MKEKNVLIVGGGPEGVRTALEQAEKGMHATIIEKFPTLGAERIPQDRLIKPGDGFVNSDLNKVRKHSNIKILTFSDIKKASQEDGKIKTESSIVHYIECNV